MDYKYSDFYKKNKLDNTYTKSKQYYNKYHKCQEVFHPVFYYINFKNIHFLKQFTILKSKDIYCSQHMIIPEQTIINSC